MLKEILRILGLRDKQIPSRGERRSYRYLSIEEIASGIARRRLSPVRMAREELDTGAVFIFGVDKLKIGFRISINGGGLSSLYLIPSADTRKKHTLDILPAVIPSAELAGTYEQHEGLDAVFYVSPADYEQFCREAEETFASYHYQGWCFRAIPDTWFPEAKMLQFIREKVLSHPALSEVMHCFDGLGTFGYSPRLDR